MVRLNWSPMRGLNDRKGLYKGPGIYMIGIMDVALPIGGKDDGYFGQNYPSAFRAKYVGMTMSTRFGVASRIKSHAAGRGNVNVKNHIKQFGINSLYFTYSESDLADIGETVFLGSISGLFDWNKKGELLGAWRRFSLADGPPSPLLADHLEIEEQLEEFEAARKIAANWDKELARYPKHVRINENIRKLRSPDGT